ncbi:MAG: ATP-binding cassette domain-containing protein [Clostridiaceae bacterium]|nr:ATP-binding cassette domain-containing protein [Clostridiaceae bacterium]
MSKSDIILEIKNLTKEFNVKTKLFGYGKTPTIKAVSDISFFVKRGETFGLVGESGCGKTTLGRCIVRGIDATSGQVMYYMEDGTKIDFLKAKEEEYKDLRKRIQMIFQDPYSSLDPRMTVYDIISEPLKACYKLSKPEIDDRVKEIGKATGLDISYLKRYPHAFSGGQRQRIGIARALITLPDIIVCDEPVSALDVSIQAQIINILKDLQAEYKMTYIFIAHDLSVVEYISDRVAVMYLGRIVELAPTEKMYSYPKHPYTEALLSAVPNPDPERKMRRIILQGEVPIPSNPPAGCHFHPRCPYRGKECDSVIPELYELEDGHYVACHYANKLRLSGIGQVQ